MMEQALLILASFALSLGVQSICVAVANHRARKL